MAAAAAYRSRRAVRERARGSAVAIFLDGGEDDHLLTSAPTETDDAAILLVADARIDNRVDVAARLNVPELAVRRDDVALLAEAYRRWGDAFARDLCGDFSVVLWDAREWRLVAARDSSGLRPLVYRVEPSRILVASDVAQILAASGVSATLDEQHIASVLAGLAGLPGSTFHDGITRLAPGCTLVADRAGTRVRAHDSTGNVRLVPASAEDHAAALRMHLTEAVRTRLDVVSVPGLLLSGGLDSISVAGCAGALRRAGNLPADLQTYSFAHAELADSDERDVSAIVVAEYGMTTTGVPADDAWPLAGHPAHGPDVDGADRGRSHVLLDNAFALAAAGGVTTLIAAQRGDSTVGGTVVDHLGVLRDAGVGAFWRDIAAHGRRSNRSVPAVIDRHVLRRILASSWPPAWAAKTRAALWRMVYGRHEFPAWIRADAIDKFHLRDVADTESPRSTLANGAQRRRHELMTDAQVGRSAEALERRFAHAGLRYVDPWADRRIAEWVLTVPAHVVTPGGESKRLLRDAMRGVVPETARLSARKRLPNPLYHARGLADRARPVVWSLIDGSRAVRRGYVDACAVRAAYTQMLASPGAVPERDWRCFWRFLDVEDWLRRFHD